MKLTKLNERMGEARICTPTTSYVTYYPELVAMADKQLVDAYWTAAEMKVENDTQDLIVNMTEAQKHATSVALKLFVKYELFVGGEHWNGNIRKMFPRPEAQRLCAAYGMVEECMHAPFYDKLNIVLGNHVDDFYTSYTEDPTLSARMGFLDKLATSKDRIVSLCVFSLMEGAVLFTSFALFKSFQSGGMNLIPVTVRGINQSIIDEGLHQIAGAALYKILCEELKATPEELAEVGALVLKAAAAIVEHEDRIIEMFFEKGSLPNLTAADMKTFVRSRVNICLNALGIESLFIIGENPIAEWFYSSAQQYQMVDFFTSGLGREYQRGWSKTDFVWSVENDEENG